MAQDTEQRECCWPSATACAKRLDRVRQEARQHKDHAHQLAVRLGSLRAQHDPPPGAGAPGAAGRAPDRAPEQLSLNLEEGEAPLEELRLKLEELLDKRMTVDEEMRLDRPGRSRPRTARCRKRRTQAEQQSQLMRGQLENSAWNGKP
jgi:chromosome segregation protein